jgi:hypothetical protein
MAAGDIVLLLETTGETKADWGVGGRNGCCYCRIVC